jgi:hypothetical protein
MDPTVYQLLVFYPDRRTATESVTVGRAAWVRPGIDDLQARHPGCDHIRVELGGTTLCQVKASHAH